MVYGLRGYERTVLLHWGIGSCSSAFVLQPWLIKINLCHLCFIALCPDDWALPLAAWSSQLYNTRLFMELPTLFPLSLLLQELQLWEVASLFLSVHHPTLGVLTCGSSYTQISYSDVLVCSLGDFCWVLDFQFIVVYRGKIQGHFSFHYVSPNPGLTFLFLCQCL